MGEADLNLIRSIETFKFESEFWKDRLINLEVENEQCSMSSQGPWLQREMQGTSEEGLSRVERDRETGRSVSIHISH